MSDDYPGLHITWGPTKVLRRESAGVRWCFGQRKRLEHERLLLDYEEPSYYEPIWVIRCSGCGQDRTRFPGTEW